MDTTTSSFTQSFELGVGVMDRITHLREHMGTPRQREDEVRQFNTISVDRSMRMSGFMNTPFSDSGVPKGGSPSISPPVIYGKESSGIMDSFASPTEVTNIVVTRKTREDNDSIQPRRVAEVGTVMATPVRRDYNQNFVPKVSQTESRFVRSKSETLQQQPDRFSVNTSGGRDEVGSGQGDSNRGINRFLNVDFSGAKFAKRPSSVPPPDEQQYGQPPRNPQPFSVLKGHFSGFNQLKPSQGINIPSTNTRLVPNPGLTVGDERVQFFNNEPKSTQKPSLGSSFPSLLKVTSKPEVVTPELANNPKVAENTRRRGADNGLDDNYTTGDFEANDSHTESSKQNSQANPRENPARECNTKSNDNNDRQNTIGNITNSTTNNRKETGESGAVSLVPGKDVTAKDRSEDIQDKYSTQESRETIYNSLIQKNNEINAAKDRLDDLRAKDKDLETNINKLTAEKNYILRTTGGDKDNTHSKDEDLKGIDDIGIGEEPKTLEEVSKQFATKLTQIRLEAKEKTHRLLTQKDTQMSVLVGQMRSEEERQHRIFEMMNQEGRRDDEGIDRSRGIGYYRDTASASMMGSRVMSGEGAKAGDNPEMDQIQSMKSLVNFLASDSSDSVQSLEARQMQLAKRYEEVITQCSRESKMMENSLIEQTSLVESLEQQLAELKKELKGEEEKRKGVFNEWGVTGYTASSMCMSGGVNTINSFKGTQSGVNNIQAGDGAADSLSASKTDKATNRVYDLSKALQDVKEETNKKLVLMERERINLMERYEKIRGNRDTTIDASLAAGSTLMGGSGASTMEMNMASMSVNGGYSSSNNRGVIARLKAKIGTGAASLSSKQMTIKNMVEKYQAATKTLEELKAGNESLSKEVARLDNAVMQQGIGVGMSWSYTSNFNDYK